jgi:hypothetical protein
MRAFARREAIHLFSLPARKMDCRGGAAALRSQWSVPSTNRTKLKPATLPDPFK